MNRHEMAQRKVVANQKVSSTVQRLAQQYREMQEDLLKPPEERRRGPADFPEEYDLQTFAAGNGVLVHVEDNFEEVIGESSGGDE
jgi:hypothetical protein